MHWRCNTFNISGHQTVSLTLRNIVGKFQIQSHSFYSKLEQLEYVLTTLEHAQF